MRRVGDPMGMIPSRLTSKPPVAGPVPAVLESSGFTVTEILTQDLGRTRVGCVVAGMGWCDGCVRVPTS